MSVVHIASGDRWAGAEVQVWTLLRQLQHMPGMRAAAILMNEGELARRLRAEGIRVHVLDEKRHGFGGLLLGVVRVLRSERPSLVHTHRQKENILGSVAAMLVGIPSVRTVHGAPEQATNSFARRAVFRADQWIAQHLQNRLIAVSQGLANALREHLPAARIESITNGIDIEEVRRTARTPADLGLSNPAVRHVGIVGRLDPVKRVDIFLRIAKELAGRTPDTWRFHVFGEGASKDALIAESQSLGLRDIVEFHGHRMDIAACLAALDVLVMCSDHEGMPMTPLEALAVGTPVVAHAVGGLVDILSGEGKGILVSVHEPASYADAIEALLPREAGLSPLRTLRDPIPFEARFEARHNAAEMERLYAAVMAQ